MLERLPTSSGNLVCFRAVGTLTEADYVEVSVPAMVEILERHRNFRLYADLSGLLDWDEASHLETGSILATNRGRFQRAAIVGGPSWAGLALLLRDSLPQGSHEFFSNGNQAKALAWVQG